MHAIVLFRIYPWVGRWGHLCGWLDVQLLGNSCADRWNVQLLDDLASLPEKSCADSQNIQLLEGTCADSQNVQLLPLISDPRANAHILWDVCSALLPLWAQIWTSMCVGLGPL